MKNEKYHTVRTFPKSYRKLQKEAKSIPLTHKYMTAHFPGMAQAFQYIKWQG
jgi:hypothetical protein